jgi:flagellar protein FliL
VIEENGDGEAASAAPANGALNKKRILFASIGLAMAASVGGAGYVFLMPTRPQAAGEENAASRQPVGFLELREILVNLAPETGNNRTKLLRLKLALEVKDPKLIPQIQPLLPRVEDTFQVFVRELRASDLDGSGGLYHLREELLRRVNYAVYPAKVEAVLFKELVVQ